MHQRPIDPETGEFVADNAVDPMHQCLKNIAVIAKAAGTSLVRGIKTSILARNLSGLAKVNGAHAEHPSAPHTARAPLEVSSLPRGALVRAEAIIAIGDS